MPANTPAPNSVTCGKALLQFLVERETTLSPLLIRTHDFPEPDAIASAFALPHLAQATFGIEATIACGGIVGRMTNRAVVRTPRVRMHRFHPIYFKHEEEQP